MKTFLTEDQIERLSSAHASKLFISKSVVSGSSLFLKLACCLAPLPKVKLCRVSLEMHGKETRSWLLSRGYQQGNPALYRGAINLGQDFKNLCRKEFLPVFSLAELSMPRLGTSCYPSHSPRSPGWAELCCRSPRVKGEHHNYQNSSFDQEKNPLQEEAEATEVCLLTACLYSSVVLEENMKETKTLLSCRD